MPYASPVSDSHHSEYHVRFRDAAAGDRMVAAITFDSDYTPNPTESAKDAFMQRVIDLFDGNPSFEFVHASKSYGMTVAVTPTP
ncbi:hypothetical protein ABZ741_34055 [Streptomyces globisporus]|uniref:hypothetical protein n=1 Tax=Streptomyces globisporus TaxID=1908 RepID=UPI00345FEC75